MTTPMRKGQPVPTRSAARPAVLAPLALAVGAILVVLGLIVAVSVGPSGRVEVTHHVDSPGITIVGEGVTRAGSAPVHVRAAASSGEAVTLHTALPEDATAMVGESRVTTISGIRFLPRSLQVETSGTGQLPRALNEDVVVGRAEGAPAELDVELSRLPLAVVVLPGSTEQPREEPVDVTLTWSNSAWFWQAVALAALGALLLGVGAILQRRRRAHADPADTAALPREGDADGARDREDPAGPAEASGSAERIGPDDPRDPAAAKEDRA